MAGNLQAILGQTFVASEVPQSDFELLPEGDYRLTVTESEMKDTVKGGVQLVFTYQVVGSALDGRKLFDRLNIKNDNQKAVEISFQTLAKLVSACGVEKVNDSSDLHGKSFMAHVEVKKGEGTYIKDGVEKPQSDQNVIKKYYPVGSMGQNQSQAATPQASAQAASAPAEGAKKMPWAK